MGDRDWRERIPGPEDSQAEVSYEWEEKQQGLFTYFLLQGLAGGADYDRDGVVNVDELYRYTFEKVPLAAQRELNARQRPVRVIGPETEGVFALSRVSLVPRPLDTSLVATFTVREVDRDGRFVEGAAVELFHRDSETDRVELLAQGDWNSTKVVARDLGSSKSTRGVLRPRNATTDMTSQDSAAGISSGPAGSRQVVEPRGTGP